MKYDVFWLVLPLEETISQYLEKEKRGRGGGEFSDHSLAGEITHWKGGKGEGDSRPYF